MCKTFFRFLLIIFIQLITASNLASQATFDSVYIEKQAIIDATELVAVYESVNHTWEVGGFVSSFILLPYLGGLASVAIAYNSGGDMEVPSIRVREILQKYPDNLDAVRFYEKKFKETALPLKRDAQGRAATTGALEGGVLWLLLVSMMAG